MTKTDLERRQELNDKFKDLTGWKGDEIVRIQEKEDDADRMLSKLGGHLRDLWQNTSLLAIPNDKLQIISDRLNDFKTKIDAEIARRV